jgi:hypothetical protein
MEKDNKELVKSTKSIDDSKLSRTTDIPPGKTASTGYSITEKGLNRLTDVINEVPTRYGMVLIKILQEELQKN